jgi:hypothetical protein
MAKTNRTALNGLDALAGYGVRQRPPEAATEPGPSELAALARKQRDAHRAEQRRIAEVFIAYMRTPQHAAAVQARLEEDGAKRRGKLRFGG